MGKGARRWDATTHFAGRNGVDQGAGATADRRTATASLTIAALPPAPRGRAIADPPVVTLADHFRARTMPRRPPPPLIDPRTILPDAGLLATFSASDCLRHGVLPWRRIQGQTVVLTETQPPSPSALAALAAAFGPVRLARCPDGSVFRVLLDVAGADLARAAEQLCPARHSCREWDFRRARRVAMGTMTALALLAATMPTPLMLALLIWTCLTLILNTALKVAAVLAVLLRPRPGPPLPTFAPSSRLADVAVLRPDIAAVSFDAALPQSDARRDAPDPPLVTLLIPLYHEREIASHLMARLGALDYPRDRLDVLLILENDDIQTRETLAALNLPGWARIVEVPEGTLRTKPRALNHALCMARGEIVGIYDAEDAPAPDQLRRVVAHFAEARPDVACLQGVLDYYNTSSNWLARCFTLEYATWFRLVLPGLARLGLVVPLGGTTLFLRRAAIDAVGGWDAHNVTEDADLGLRLARAGYRTELIDSVTCEEANARAWPWVRQRTRWLKGYAMTWAVHMARPRDLVRDLGPWRFFGVQVLFLGTLSQFCLAPVLWSFWLIVVGLPHPLRAVLSDPVLFGLGALFLGTEVVNLAVAALAARRAGRPWLALWAPTLQVYFPLATIAAWRALAEMCSRPFFWDKTLHGIFLPGATPSKRRRPMRRTRRRL